MEILRIENISKSFDGVIAVDDFSCTINKDEIIGLIGPNGAGKTTVFNIVTGFLRSSNGRIIFKNKDITNLYPEKIVQYGISRTFQDLRLIMQMTLLENLLLWCNDRLGEKITNIFFMNKKLKEIEVNNYKEAFSLLEFVGLKEKANEKAGNLSYGQQKLLSLTCCLAAKPSLLLLDEPASGIQPVMLDEIIRILRELHNQGKTIFFIEHDLEFVFKVADRVIVMDDGKKIAEDLPDSIRTNKDILEAYLL